MTKSENATPLPGKTAAAAAPAENTTSGGKVKLEIHRQQAFVSKLELGEHTLVRGGDPIEVDKADAEKLLQRRDEQGRRYVAEAKSDA